MKKKCEMAKPESSGPSGGKRKEREDDEEYGKGKGKQKKVGSEREKEEMAVEDDWEDRLEAARIASEKELAEEYRASACRYCRSKGIKCVRSG